MQNCFVVAGVVVTTVVACGHDDASRAAQAGTDAATEVPTDDGAGTAGSGTADDGSSDTGADDDRGTDDGTADDGSTAVDTTDDGQGPYEAPVYPVGRTHSPVTPFVADRWSAVAERSAAPFEDVFMKVGASSTVSPNTLYCFAGDGVDLGAHQALLPSLQFFLGGDAAGTTPFDRVSLAAQVGRHAGWAIAGDPSPLAMEVAALAPRTALVHYGANDMGWGATYADALQGLYGNMTALLDELLGQGIVPVVFGMTRRGDSPGADRWVATYNATLRGLAQQRQIPFIDMHHAIDPLPGHGLSADGLHLEAFAGGACVLTEEGLGHGYNVRNLIALQALDRLVGVLVDDAPAPDDPADPALRLVGVGDEIEPWEIATLPFTATQDTTWADARVAAYPACDDADESGPEQWYRLTLAQPTALRIMVLDPTGVDIDIQVLDQTARAEGCLARHDSLLQGTLPAGTYFIVADTWAGAGTPLSGRYTLLVVPCDAQDPSCAAPL